MWCVPRFGPQGSAAVESPCLSLIFVPFGHKSGEEQQELSVMRSVTLFVFPLCLKPSAKISIDCEFGTKGAGNKV